MALDCLIFAGTANPALASAIAQDLGVRTAACSVERFPDGETSVRLDVTVRGREVFLIQPTSPPVNDHLVELLLYADACRRAAAARITAVVPYFGYARSDRRHGRRESIAASLAARMMQTAGIDHLVTLDLHAAQIEGFFQIPVDCLSAVQALCAALGDRVEAGTVVVSPDVGRVEMATEFASRLGTQVAVLEKRRSSGTETAVTRVVGDVRGRPCLIIDDMISTGGTLARAAEALTEAGARPAYSVAATHGLFVGEARLSLERTGIRRVIVTDSVNPTVGDWPLVQVVSVAPLLATAIRRILADGSP